MLLTAKGVLTFGELEGLPLHVYMVGWDEEVLTGTLSSNWVKCQQNSEYLGVTELNTSNLVCTSVNHETHHILCG